MSGNATDDLRNDIKNDIKNTVEAIYRTESRRVLATLIRMLGGDFYLAEEALHEAFHFALAQQEPERRFLQKRLSELTE